MHRTHKLVVLTTITFLFFLLVLHKLDFEAFWLDEAMTAEIAAQPIEKIWQLRQYDYNPPLYDYVTKGVMTVFNDSEFTLRVPTALAYAAGILMVGLFFISQNLLTTILATILFGFSFQNFYFAREARPYAFVFLFSLAATLLALCKIQKNESWKNWQILVLALLLTLNSYMHYIGVIFSFAFTLNLFAFKQRLQLRGQQFLALVFLQFCLYLPWLNTIFVHSKSVPEHVTNDSVSFSRMLSELVYFMAGHPYVIYFTATLFVIALVFTYHKNKNAFYNLLFTHAAWATPLLVTLFIISRINPWQLHPRYVFESLPGFLLACVLSVYALFALNKKMAYAYGLILILIFSALFYKQNPFQRRKDDERGAAQFVASNTEPCKTVITSGRKIASYYYFKKLNLKIDIISLYEPDYQNRINRACPDVYFYEYFFSSREHADQIDIIKKRFTDSKYELKEKMDFHNMKVTHMKKFTTSK